jgi:hypothetical protein
VAVDEVRLRLRRKLEELVGVEEADLLMDRPPGGWNALVTKEWLDERLTHERELTNLRLESLEHRLLGEIDRAFTAQTWRLMGSIISATAIVVAALKI